MRGIVLVSGGLDSCTVLAKALESSKPEDIVAVSVNYNQKHSRELECAKKVAEYYGVRHEVLDLSQVYAHSNCALLKQSDEAVPETSYAQQLKDRKDNGVLTVVPFRNGLLLSAVAGMAQSIFPDQEVIIGLGNHMDDAAGNAYADCSEEFIAAMREAISIGTYHKVYLWSPLVNMNKAQIVKEGLRLNAPYHLTTSCYNGRDEACGKCGTCLDRLAAFEANGVIDPIDYEIELNWSGCKKIEYAEV